MKFLNFKKTAIKALVIALLSTMLVIGTVSAAEFPQGGVIPAGMTVSDDVFLSGDEVVMDGIVEGMLVATGRTITINGIVDGDALLLGERIVINTGAEIRGNVFLGAGQVTVNGLVAGSLFGASSAIELGEETVVERNLYYGGFSLNAAQGSSIGKDLFAGVYQSKLNGQIARDLKVGGSAFELNGSVGRNANINIGDASQTRNPEEWIGFTPWQQYIPPLIQPGVRVGSAANIGGDLTFTGVADQTSLFETATAGSLVYQTPVPYAVSDYPYQHREAPVGFRSFWGLTVWNAISRTIMLLALGALAIWVFLKPLRKAVDAAYRQPLQAAGWGFVVMAVGLLAMMVIPVIFILVAILIGILSLGGLLFTWLGVVGSALLFAVILFMFAIFTVSAVIVVFIIGRWLGSSLFPKSVENPWIHLAIGIMIYVVVRMIPILGGLVFFVGALVGTGALWMMLRSYWMKGKKAQIKS
jgi:hypothetical protein